MEIVGPTAQLETQCQTQAPLPIKIIFCRRNCDATTTHMAAQICSQEGIGKLYANITCGLQLLFVHFTSRQPLVCGIERTCEESAEQQIAQHFLGARRTISLPEPDTLPPRHSPKWRAVTRACRHPCGADRLQCGYAVAGLRRRDEAVYSAIGVCVRYRQRIVQATRHTPGSRRINRRERRRLLHNEGCG